MKSALADSRYGVVRHVIFRGQPPAPLRPAFQSDDYRAMLNSNALPRAFVPHHVEAVADDDEQLEMLLRRNLIRARWPASNRR